MCFPFFYTFITKTVMDKKLSCNLPICNYNCTLLRKALLVFIKSNKMKVIPKYRKVFHR